MLCCEDMGFLKNACEKRIETKTFMFCSSHGQFYLAACKNREIFKKWSGVTDIFKLKKIKIKIQQKYF